MSSSQQGSGRAVMRTEWRTQGTQWAPGPAISTTHTLNGIVLGVSFPSSLVTRASLPFSSCWSSQRSPCSRTLKHRDQTHLPGPWPTSLPNSAPLTACPLKSHLLAWPSQPPTPNQPFSLAFWCAYLRHWWEVKPNSFWGPAYTKLLHPPIFSSLPFLS